MSTVTQKRRSGKGKNARPVASELAKRKLSVFIEPELMKAIRQEKADSEPLRTIEEIVNGRLRLSYRDHPGQSSAAN